MPTTQAIAVIEPEAIRADMEGVVVVVVVVVRSGGTCSSESTVLGDD